MRHTIITGLAMVLALWAAKPAAAAPPPLPNLATFPDSMGVNIHFTDPRPGELEQIYAAGFRWVRMDFGWGGIERKKGEYDFAAYDRLISALDQHHIHAYFIFDYSNRNYDNDLSPHSDEGRAAFAKWAAASVHHFAGHGVIWEMYNEPNITFWRPKTNVDDYAKLALAVGRAIRETEPGEIYIGPATSTIDMGFLEACFKAGCLEYWSAVSIHPYRQTAPETTAEEYRRLRHLIATYAPSGRTIPIISGEWGYSSVWKDFDENRQAKYLPRELLTNLADDVPLSIWYDWHEDGKDPHEGEHHFGIVRPDEVNKDGNLYEPKKAYLAANRMSEILKGYHFSKRLENFGPEFSVLLFADETGKPVVVAWHLGNGAAPLTLPMADGAIVKDAFGPGEKKVATDPKTNAVQISVDEFPTYILPAGDDEFLRVAAAWTRAPMEISAAGPTNASIATTVRNPLNHAIVITGREHPTTLKPGESLVLNPEVAVGRESIRVPSELVVEGLGRAVQMSYVDVTNPLKVQLLPAIGHVQYALIENPSGQAVTATAHLIAAADDQAVPVKIKAGEKEKVVTFAVGGAAGLDMPAAVKLTTNKPLNVQLVATTSSRRSLLPSFAVNPAQAWMVTPDGDSKVASEQTLVDANPPGGPIAPNVPAVRLAYRFDDGWKFIRVAPKPTVDETLKSDPIALGLWVYGDGSGNIARMRFSDASGQTFQPDGGRIDFKGWRYIQFNLTGHDAHWGGKDDGVVHGAIKIDTLFLLDSHDRHATRGEIYLAAPTLVYGK